MSNVSVERAPFIKQFNLMCPYFSKSRDNLKKKVLETMAKLDERMRFHLGCACASFVAADDTYWWCIRASIQPEIHCICVRGLCLDGLGNVRQLFDWSGEAGRGSLLDTVLFLYSRGCLFGCLCVIGIVLYDFISETSWTICFTFSFLYRK